MADSIFQFYTALFPLGGDPPSAEAFFKSYLALPVVLLFWAGGFLWKRTGWLRTHQMDVDTGRRQVNWELVNKERERIRAMPVWRRALTIAF